MWAFLFCAHFVPILCPRRAHHFFNSHRIDHWCCAQSGNIKNNGGIEFRWIQFDPGISARTTCRSVNSPTSLLTGGDNGGSGKSESQNLREVSAGSYQQESLDGMTPIDRCHLHNVHLHCRMDDEHRDTADVAPFEFNAR